MNLNSLMFNVKDKIMRDNEFIRIRNELSEKIEPLVIKSKIDDWNYYINIYTKS